MSANKEFPKPFGYKDWLLQKSKVDDWFKRCIEDFPTLIHETNHLSKGTIRRYSKPPRQIQKWFDAYFSQFRNKCQK